MSQIVTITSCILLLCAVLGVRACLFPCNVVVFMLLRLAPSHNLICLHTQEYETAQECGSTTRVPLVNMMLESYFWGTRSHPP